MDWMVKNPEKANSPLIDKPHVQDVSSCLVKNPQRMRVRSLSAEVVVRIDEEFVPLYFRNYSSIFAKNLSIYCDFLTNALKRKHRLAFYFDDGMR